MFGILSTNVGNFSLQPQVELHFLMPQMGSAALMSSRLPSRSLSTVLLPPALTQHLEQESNTVLLASKVRVRSNSWNQQVVQQTTKSNSHFFCQNQLICSSEALACQGQRCTFVPTQTQSPVHVIMGVQTHTPGEFGTNRHHRLICKEASEEFYTPLPATAPEATGIHRSATCRERRSELDRFPQTLCST